MIHIAKLRADVGDEPISCVVQDLIKGRPTEVIGYFNGLVVKKGEKLGVPVFWNKAVSLLMKKIEQGELIPNLSLLEKLSDKITGKF